jgi:DNA-binding CsgD family transcriptional regulator
MLAGCHISEGDSDSMVLTERDRQLSYLRQLFAESASGSGRIAIVSGPVGTGKTALLNVFSEYATELGGRSLTAVGSRAEQTVPLGLLRQLFQSRVRSPELSERITAVLDEGTRFLAHSEPTSAASDQMPYQVMDDLSAIFFDLADQRPLLIGIDDLQYSDEASLQSLLYFFRRLGSAPILVVLNESMNSEANSLFKTECLSLPYCRRIRLTPISRDGVAEILDEHLGEQRGGDLAAAWYMVSGGNPVLIHALLEDCEMPARATLEESPEEDPVVGNAFSQAMMNCLYRCEPRLLRVCQALAVAGESGSPALVARVVGMEPEAASQAIDELNAAGLLERGRFRHPVAMLAVRGDLTPTTRAEMQLQMARCLHDDGAPATSIARQLVAAGQIADDWGIPILQEAAESLLSDDQVELSVACLELAHRSCADNEQQAIALSMLARAEWRVNPSVAGRNLPQLAAAVHGGHLRGRHAAALIRYLLWYGRIDEARGVLNRLEGSGPGQLDKETISELHYTRLWMSCSYPALPADIPPPANPAAIKSISPLAVTAGMRAASVLRNILAHGAEGKWIVGAEKVLEGSRLADATAEPLGTALFSLIYAEQLDKANYWCDVLMKEAGTRKAPWWQAMLAALRAEIAIRQGDLPSAKYHADAALTHVPMESWGVAVGVPLAILVKASTAMGRYDEAASYLDQSVTDEIFQTRFGLHYLHARGHFHLAKGRFYAALDDFLTCGELMTSWGIDLPALVPWRIDAAEGYLRLGKRAKAEELINEQLSMLGGIRSRTRGISLRLLAAASEPRWRPQFLVKAAEVLQECDDRFELARVFADLSQAYHALGDMARARKMMLRAWYAAKECQSEMLCQELLPNLAKNNINMPFVTSMSVDEITTLTSAERRVAVLAAQGQSNRDIAKELYVTVSTVEQHLTRVYRKLNVTRREGLPLRLLPSMANRA